jgi:lipoprotein signal peptidase
MSERSYRVLLWALALIGLAADQASKYGIFRWLDDGASGGTFALFQVEPSQRALARVPDADDNKDRGFFLAPRFDLRPDGTRRPHVNQGALFGWGREQRTAANLGFAAISLLAALAIAYWSTQKSTAADRWLCAALGLILAGTLGNFYDRVVFEGVRDFLHWHYLFNWPVFNVADSCLVCGAGLLLLQAFTSPQPQAARPQQAAEALAKEAAAPAAATSPSCVGATTGPKD